MQLEGYLAMGAVPLGLGLLDGSYIPIHMANLVPPALHELLQSTYKFRGQVVVKCMTNLRNCVGKALALPIKSIHVNYRRAKMTLVFRSEVDMRELFDGMMKVLKPREIPP